MEAHFIPGIDSEADKAEVLALSLHRLGVLGAFQTDRKPTKIRRRITIQTRRAVCDMIRVSTWTSHPAKLKLLDKPKFRLARNLLTQCR